MFMFLMSYFIFDAPLRILVGGNEELPAQLPDTVRGTVQMAGISSQCFTVRGNADGMDMVLSSVGLPVEGIALVAGVDRIFDMGRTTVNITGDASCAIIVSAMERKKHKS